MREAGAACAREERERCGTIGGRRVACGLGAVLYSKSRVRGADGRSGSLRIGRGRVGEEGGEEAQAGEEDQKEAEGDGENLCGLLAVCPAHRDARWLAVGCIFWTDANVLLHVWVN